jgi:hypothetical protein
MKTDRLTLLISPADKAAINARAELLGVSVSELVRTAALDYEPELKDEKAQLEALLGEIEFALGRIDDNLDAMIAGAETHRQEMAYLASDEYREKVRQQILADPNIDWQGLRQLVGSGPVEAIAA